MKKLVSTVAKSRFEKYHQSFPEDWEITYVDVPYEEDELIKACKNADYLFVGSVDPVSDRLFKECSHLKLVHVEGVGFDKVDTEAAAKLGIPVCNNRAVNNTSVAEHTVGLILAAMRRTALDDAQLKAGNYGSYKKVFLSQGEHELAGKHVGLIGFGAIGREVARRLAGWDCTISYYDAYRPSEDVEKSLNVDYLELDELVRECDVISLHVPVLPSTFHMINDDRFNEMKPTAYLVNTARGEIVDQEALIRALIGGKIAGAALDTVTPEPLPADDPLLKMPQEALNRLTLTPHIGGTTDEAFTRMLKNAIANFERVENGEKPINVVNKVS